MYTWVREIFSGHPKQRGAPLPSELGHVVQDGDLLAGLEGRQPDVGAVGAAEGVAEGAAAAAARLALDREVQLVEVLGLELERAEVLVRLGAAGLVLRLDALRQAAGAVLAGAALLAGLGLALWCCLRWCVSMWSKVCVCACACVSRDFEDRGTYAFAQAGSGPPPS